MDGWGYIYIYNIKELGLISFVFLTEVSLAQQTCQGHAFVQTLKM
jgi:hypothetical protein